MKDYKKIEALIRLNQLNIGDVVTEQTEKDLREITGKRIEMRSIGSVHFDKVGNAHTLNDDVFESVIVDGRDILVKPSAQKSEGAE